MAHALTVWHIGIAGETDKSDDDAEEDETLGRRDEEPMECMVPTSLTMLPSPIETSSPKTSHKGFSNNETQQQQQPTHICEVFEDEIHGKALILPLMTFRDVQNALGKVFKEEGVLVYWNQIFCAIRTSLAFYKNTNVAYIICMLYIRTANEVSICFVSYFYVFDQYWYR